MKDLDKTTIDTVFESDSSHSSSSSSSGSSIDTTECTGKLWQKPRHHHHHSTPEDTSNEDCTESNNDLMDQDASFFYALAKESVPSNSKHRHHQQHQQQQHQQQHRRHGNQNLAVTRNSSNDTSSKRQTKLLLVSLIESLCRTYGDSPESTRKIFMMICETLSSLGFIDSEFMDEVAGARSAYHKAFEQLFYTAAQTVRQQELRLGKQPKLLTSAQQQEILKERIEALSASYSSTSSMESLARDAQEEDEQDEEEISRPLNYSLSIQQSRYNNDFVQVGMLGRGGFASAWKARNKLDDIEYAIKKIRLLDQEEDDGYDKIFREIKNLARLEHHNVVRYYSSWLEYAASMDDNGEEEDDDEDISWLSSPSESNQDDNSSIFNGQDPTFEPSEDSLNNNQPTTIEEMSFISFGTSDNEPSEPGNMQLCASSSNSTIRKSCRNPTATANNGPKQKQETGGFILFIQMQLCPSTLHEYIKFRNQKPNEYFDDQQNLDLFSQILQGCAYIHQQGLIHRDLKPSNIFLSRPATVPEHRYRRRNATPTDSDCKCCSEAMVPKIGDFGLAASVLHGEDDEDEPLDDEDEQYLASTFESQQSSSSGSIIELFTASHSHSRHHHHHHHHSHHHKNEGSSSNSDSILSLHAANSFKNKGRPRLRRSRTSGVGTRTYAAPEQLATPSYNYDEKADIYSLGIILFELYNPFSSGMERAIAIDQLKKGIFPDKFSQLYPAEKHVISQMMNPDPCLRPTALEILDLDIFNRQPSQPAQPAQEAIESQASGSSLSCPLTAAAAELNIMHNREMAEMRDRYSQMKQEKEDLQRRLDELELKLNHCNVEEHPNKRPHESCPEEEEETTTSAEHGHLYKKKEMDGMFQSTLLAKFMMPN